MWLEALSEAEILDVLEGAMHATLGCHAHGKTYVVPISFVWDGRRILGMTSEGMKILMMRENPFVCVQAAEVHNIAHWRSVILWGRFVELAGIERAQVAGSLIERYGPAVADFGSDQPRGRNVTPPALDGRPSPVIVYAIEVAEKTGRAEDA